MSYQSSTAKFTKEIYRRSGHPLVKKNLRAIALNKEMDSLYQMIEEDYEEYKELLAFLPFSEFTSNEYIFYGLMLIKGKLGIYRCVRPIKHSNKKAITYTFTEYQAANIETTYQELSRGYLKTCFYFVTIFDSGKNICSFNSGKKIYCFFDKALEEEKTRLK